MSNYPPGVTGCEPQIVGGDDATITYEQEQRAWAWSIGWRDGAARRESNAPLLRNKWAPAYRAGRRAGVNARAQAQDRADSYAVKPTSRKTGECENGSSSEDSGKESGL